jgi:hypothetical protein
MKCQPEARRRLRRSKRGEREELRLTKERLQQAEEGRRLAEERHKRELGSLRSEERATRPTSQNQVSRTPPMASPVETRGPRSRGTCTELVSVLPNNLNHDLRGLKSQNQENPTEFRRHRLPLPVWPPGSCAWQLQSPGEFIAGLGAAGDGVL